MQSVTTRPGAPRAVSLCLAALAVVLASPPARADDAVGTVTGRGAAKPAKFLRDTVVYLKTVPYKAAPKAATVDQVGMAFVPHILLITTGDTVTFTNHDQVAHSVVSADGKYDLGSWGPGQSKAHKFTRPGVFAQLCKLHPEMLAYVFVGQNPYAAVVDASGAFTITGVPPGTYELDVWNSTLKAPGQTVTVTAGGSTTASFALKR